MDCSRSERGQEGAYLVALVSCTCGQVLVKLVSDHSDPLWCRSKDDALAPTSTATAPLIALVPDDDGSAVGHGRAQDQASSHVAPPPQHRRSPDGYSAPRSPSARATLARRF